MIQYEHPEAFYLLLLLIPIAGLFLLFLWGRRKAIQRLGEGSLIARLMPEKPAAKHIWKFGFAALSLICLIIALANPQIGQSYEKVQRQGVDLMIAIDISQSMLAEDETPNRLDRSKQFVSRLIDRLGGDRVGLILFAGNAYLQVPITSDYTAAKTFLRTISPDLAATQGTAIGAAIRLADEAFERAERQHAVMLIISDGENHEGDAIAAARESVSNGMVIHTMGVGSAKGEPIPIYQGNRRVGYKQDRQGSIVYTKMNPQMLQEVAEAGEGMYLKLQSGNGETEALLDQLAAMEQKEYEEHAYSDYEDQFQWFLVAGLLFLVIEFLLSERKNRWLTDWKIFQS
ncbi:MAG: VWA domain-containing protein [Bacteroidota bacterium]